MTNFRKRLRNVAVIFACLAVVSMFSGCKGNDDNNGNSGNGGDNPSISYTLVLENPPTKHYVIYVTKSTLTNTSTLSSLTDDKANIVLHGSNDGNATTTKLVKESSEQISGNFNVFINTYDDEYNTVNKYQNGVSFSMGGTTTLNWNTMQNSH